MSLFIGVYKIYRLVFKSFECIIQIALSINLIQIFQLFNIKLLNPKKTFLVHYPIQNSSNTRTEKTLGHFEI